MIREQIKQVAQERENELCEQPIATFLLDGIDTYLRSEGFKHTFCQSAPGESGIGYTYKAKDYTCEVEVTIKNK